MDSSQRIAEITNLRQRLKRAEQAVTEASIRHEQSKQDLATAEEEARRLGIDPKPRAFEAWLDKETTDIEGLISNAEDSLAKVKEALRGS